MKKIIIGLIILIGLIIISFIIGRYFPIQRITLDCSHISDEVWDDLWGYDDCIRSYINTGAGHCEGRICDMKYNFLKKPRQ